MSDTHNDNDSAHTDHPHAQDAGSDFGEVIPKKNWQDSLLAYLAAVSLAALALIYSSWLTAPLAIVSEQSHVDR